MKKIASIVVVCALALVLVACGGGNDSKLVGTYNMTKIEVAGVSMDVAQFAEAAGMDADIFNLVLNEDGTFELNFIDGTGGSDSQEGTWKSSGNTLTLTAEGEDLKVAVDGTTLTIEEEEDGQTMKMVFEKV